MGTDDLIQWLLDNRGPVIRYRTLRDLAGDGIVIDDETLLRRLE